MKKLLSLLFSVAAISAFGQAEVESNVDVSAAVRAERADQHNPNSINPIPKYEHHTKVRVWRTIDLREKQNKGFFASNGEITKLIVNSVKSGELTSIYKDDSLKTTYGKDEFLSRLYRTQEAPAESWDPKKQYFSGDIVKYNNVRYEAAASSTGKNPASNPNDWSVTQSGAAQPYLVSDISILRMMEDVIFDRRRSRLYYDIQAVQLVIPGMNSERGIEEPLAWFSYKDLEKVFRNHPKEAIWFNRQNTAQNKNYADAFLLRLFHGTIHKVENPDDATIFDTYADRPYQERVWATEWAEMQLMEKEHNLWEY